MRLPLLLITLIVFSITFGVFDRATSSELGRNGFSGNPITNGGATCNVCHDSGAAIPNILITGPTVVDAGTTNEYTVTITGGPAQTAGTNISMSNFDGLLAPADSELQLINKELSHTAPKSFQTTDATFDFLWTAPSHNTNSVVYVAGNSSNGQVNLAGDGINTNTLAITVQNGSQPPPPNPPPPSANIALDEFVSGLASPVAIAHANDQRIFVVERAGRIRVIDGSGNLLSMPYLDIDNRVDSSGGEQGLLGIAFHPDYAQTGYLYVYYTRDPGPGLDRSRISRFQVTANSNLADPSSELVIMEFEQPQSNHNAGDLHFGPDGYLYIASGDGGGSGDPSSFAQNKNSLLGKLLRVDVDGPSGSNDGPDCDISGNSNYRIPPSNAFSDGAGGQGCDEIFALGLRNPWRFSFDRLTGDLWIADVGQSNYEEIDWVLFGSAGGMNFGWRCYEGNQPFNTNGCDDEYFFPAHEFSHANGNCSVTGGFVYRGIEYPELDGHYFFTDFCNTSIRTLRDSGNALVFSEVLAAGGINAPSAFGEDADGELYIASLSEGRLFKVRSLESDPPLNQAPTVSSPGDQVNTEGDTIELAIDASDPDGDTLTYSATGLPDSLSIDGNSGVISGVIDVGSAATYPVTVEVSDGMESGAVAFDWLVFESQAVVIVDDLDANTQRTGSWPTSSGDNPNEGHSVYNNGGNTFTWLPALPSSGTYEVYAWWTYHANRSSQVPYRISHDGGTAQVTVNQLDPGLAGQWNLLGSFSLTAGTNGEVSVSSENGQANADAVRLINIDPDPPPPQAVVIVDDLDANTQRTGSWPTSSGDNPNEGHSVYNNGGNTFTWLPALPTSGTYEVYAWWTYHANRSSQVPYRISHDGGTAQVTVNQLDPGLAGQWNLLGSFSLTAGTNGEVSVSSENGQANADAVRWVKTGSP